MYWKTLEDNKGRALYETPIFAKLDFLKEHASLWYTKKKTKGGFQKAMYGQISFLRVLILRFWRRTYRKVQQSEVDEGVQIVSNSCNSEGITVSTRVSCMYRRAAG